MTSRRSGIERDGYRKTNRGTKGVRTMSLRDGDEIVGVSRFDLDDQLFMLTGSGMMIRMVSGQKGNPRKGDKGSGLWS